MCQTPSSTAPSSSSTSATELPLLSADAPACGCGGHGHAHAAPPTEQTVHSLQEAMQVGETVRWVASGHDADYPPVPFPSLRVIRSAGEARLRAVVWRHHTLLRASPVGHLFPTDDEKFARGTDKTADFIVEACGGPANFTPQFGHTCMRTRHFPFTIDETARETWLDLLWQALDEEGLPNDVREEYWNWLEAMSIRMINRRTIKAAPARRPYAAMAAQHGLPSPT